MNNNTNSGRKAKRPKKSRQTKKKDPEKWTFGRALLFLFITFDLIAVLAWLIYYHSHYKIISTIVGGVWTAVITFLSYMRIKKARRMSLVAFIQILPVKMVIITYTVIIFLLAGVFVLEKFPVHTVHITALVNKTPQSGVSILWDKETHITGEDGTLKIPSVKAGNHTLKWHFPNYVSGLITVPVSRWKLKQSQELLLEPIPPKPFGNVRIVSSFKGKAYNGAEIYIDGIDQNKQTPETLEHLPAGECSIKLLKTDEDYNYKAEKNIIVKAGDTIKVEIELIPITGNIHISSNIGGEAFNGAEIYFDGEKQNIQTPATLRKLAPGEYSIRLINTDENYYYEAKKNITVKAGETTKEEIELTLVSKLCELYIRSKPTSANIYINGEPRGTTDTTVILIPGIEYMIRLEKSGYETASRKYKAKEPKDMITIPLTPKKFFNFE